MKTEVLENGKIKVALSSDDLKELHITYEDMDYKNVETRRVIWSVLGEAQTELGKNINTDGKILIELCPAKNGGCFMFFTTAPKESQNGYKHLVMKKCTEPLLLKYIDENALIDSFRVLKNKTHFLEKWYILKINNCCYCALFPKISHSAEISYIFGEYGDINISSETEVSVMIECGQLLKDSTAKCVSSAEKM